MVAIENKILDNIFFENIIVEVELGQKLAIVPRYKISTFNGKKTSHIVSAKEIIDKRIYSYRDECRIKQDILKILKCLEIEINSTIFVVRSSCNLESYLIITKNALTDIKLSLYYDENVIVVTYNNKEYYFVNGNLYEKDKSYNLGLKKQYHNLLK